MNRLQSRAKQQGGLVVARGPLAFAIDALPGDLELRIDQDDRLGAPATRAHIAMSVENLMDDQASLHNRVVGSRKDDR